MCVVIVTKELVGTSTEKLSKLVAQWEEHRAPLITKYRELREQDSQLTAQTTDLLEEIKIVRERMKEVAEEARHKDDLYKQLVWCSHLENPLFCLYMK